MTNKIYSFDAEQLELAGLGKLDKDQITWITIKGNHIPIPKGGTREQKSQAIKTWFANKKKELPQAKGRMSFYSAKVEHEAPKKTARGSGEGAQVHGEGQYTLKYAKNNYENYFKKFGINKTLEDTLTMEEKRSLHGWGSALLGGGLRDFATAKRKMETEIHIKKGDIESSKNELERYEKLGRMKEDEVKELLKNPDEMKKLGVPDTLNTQNEFWRWANSQATYYRNNLQRSKDYLDKTETALENLQRYKEEGKIWEESGIYTMGGKIFKRDSASHRHTENGIQWAIMSRFYQMPIEKRKQRKEEEIAEIEKHIADYEKHLEELRKNSSTNNDYYWDKRSAEESIRLYNRELAWWKKFDVEDIKPAQAQMSKVELPASKTYLREATSLRNQSSHIKANVKEAIVDAYQVNRLRDYGLNDIADEFESIIDDALGLNNANSSGKHIEAMLDNVKDRLGTAMPEDLIKGIKVGNPDYNDVAEKSNFPEITKLHNAKRLVDEMADNIKVTLLAKKDDELVINNGRGLYNKLGRIIANKKTKSYWGASERQGQLEATKLLSKHNISGIAYTGHGRSRVSGYTDSEGNVTFDPATIKVLERTTDPNVIQQWIKEQEQHGQKEHK